MPETVTFPEWYHDAFKEMVEKNKPAPALGLPKTFVWAAKPEGSVTDLLFHMLTFNEEANNLKEALSNLDKAISLDVRNGMSLKDSYAEHEFLYS